jgi:hypothetical protein
MIVNIIGCGPTGMTIAWYLSQVAEVHVYDKKPGPGGSWWEPDSGERNLHSTRSVFKGGFVNTVKLFKEMGLEWSDYFGTIPSDENFLFKLMKHLKPKDYWELTVLSINVLVDPLKYKQLTLRQSLGKLSPSGERIISSMCFLIDGVSWDKMTAYEFVKSFDWVGLSKKETQIISGAKMNRDMERALLRRGVNFHYETEVLGIRYGVLDHEVIFSHSDETVTGDLLVLAVDHGQAKYLMGENWGSAPCVLREAQYQSVTLILEYPNKVSEFDILVSTPWNIVASTLPDGKSLCVVLVDMDSVSPSGRSVKTSSPEEILDEIYIQTGISTLNARVCWGSEWDGNRWIHHQTSGVLSVEGGVPHWGRCPTVALCGMMSPRNTPFASIEAAVEIGMRFSGVEPSKPLMVTDLLIGVLLVFILKHLLTQVGVRI